MEGQGDDGNGQVSGGHDIGSSGGPTAGDPSRRGDQEGGPINRPAGEEDDATAQSKKIVPLYRQTDWDRVVDEKASLDEWRGDVQRDFARLVHSPSFRRLQGKTQLFPSHESDFFRNRLTHSLEVAQIAESIALRVNNLLPYFSEHPINSKLCAVAGLIHDLGHPPFGHNGESALDDQMREYGGFEGNAQSLRIIGRLEKKFVPNQIRNGPICPQGDERVGLNLTYRTLACALKYDRKIPHVRGASDHLVKGYYAEEAELVENIKKSVAPGLTLDRSFKTIECSIMDIADDIAYSTYDLEDSLKAGFLTPADILSSGSELLGRVAAKVRNSLPRSGQEARFEAEDVLSVFWDIFSDIADDQEANETEIPPDSKEKRLYEFVRAFSRSNEVARSGYLRGQLTSQLVGEFINSISVTLNEEFPPLSRVHLSPTALKKVETMKNYTYEATIYSTRLKVAEYRGYEVVSSIFDALSEEKGYLLMPDDVRELYRRFEGNATKRHRIISDFIAGMTDRFALEFYGRLHSDNPQSIFKPV